MIERSAGLWQFGRLYDYGVIERITSDDTHTKQLIYPKKGSPFWKIRSLFFSYRFEDVISMENELFADFSRIADLWGLFGHAHIWLVQNKKPFFTNMEGWKKGLEYFEKGLALFPDSKLLEYDCIRANAVIKGKGITDFPVPERWADRFLSAYLWLFLLYAPFLSDTKRDASGVFASASLPNKLVSMAKFLMETAETNEKRYASILLLCDLLAFSNDTDEILRLIDDKTILDADFDNTFIEKRTINTAFLTEKAFAHVNDDNSSYIEIEPVAAKSFLQAMEIEPENPVHYGHIAHLYTLIEEYDTAGAYLEKAKELFGTHETLLFAEGALNISISQQTLDENWRIYKGIELLEKAAALNPYRAELYEYLGTGYSMTGEHEKALRTYRRLVKLKPWHKEYFLALGELLLRTPMQDEPYRTRRKRLREAVTSLVIYRKTDIVSEYAASLILSGLAKLYSAEYARSIEFHTVRDEQITEMANIHREINDFIESLDEQIIDSVDFLAYVGFELYINNVPETGQDFLVKALAAEPAHPYALQSYGVVLEDKGLSENNKESLQEAFQHFKRAFEYETDPFTKGRYLLYLVDFLPSADLNQLASGYLKQGIDAMLPVPELYDRMADEYVKNSRDDLALDILEKGKTLFPENGELTFRMGKELIREGRFIQGIKLLEELLVSHSSEPLYWNQLGISYIDWANGLIKPDEAEKGYRKGLDAFMKAVELAPDSPLFIGNCGDAYRLLGEFEKAKDLLQKAADISPEDSFYYYVLAKIYWEEGLTMDEGKQEPFVHKSEGYFSTAQSLDPDNVRYFQDMGDMYYYFGYFVDAVDKYRKALEIESELPALYDSIGLCYYQLREFDEAVEWFSLGLEYAGDSGEILNSIGLCYYEQGKFEEAQQFFKRASDSDPANSVFLDNVLLTQYKLMGFDGNWNG